jgi:hypothetical protein
LENSSQPGLHSDTLSGKKPTVSSQNPEFKPQSPPPKTQKVKLKHIFRALLLNLILKHPKKNGKCVHLDISPIYESLL